MERSSAYLFICSCCSLIVFTLVSIPFDCTFHEKTSDVIGTLDWGMSSIYLNFRLLN